MQDEGTLKWAVGIFGGAVLGIYGFFIRHISNHVAPSEIKELWDKKQDKSSCSEIVRRIDENHKETCKKLDRILTKLDV